MQQLLIQDGLQASDFLGTHIIRMFSACGCISEANQTFARLPAPSVYTWSALLLVHASTGLAIELYHHLLQSNVRPNAYCYAALLKACANSAATSEKGMLLHDHIVQDAFDSNAVINNTLIDMYVKLGDLKHAFAVFKASCVQSVVTWTTIISGYASDEHPVEAFQLYQEMLQKGVYPNPVTFTSILKACSKVDEGRLVHFHVAERGLEHNVFLGNAFIDMYAEFGSLGEARFVFDHLRGRDVVTWSTMIEGYAEGGHGKEAFWLFLVMQEEVQPNRVTFVNVVKACATLESPTISKFIHMFVVEGGYDLDTLLGTALIDMYAKCGSFADANVLFKALPAPNVVTWTAMIAGYAVHGDLEVALKYYVDMQQEGLEPNEVTFLSLLSACNHLGYLYKGYSLLDSMAIQGLQPTVEHYHCMVDLLGRTGCLNLASVVLQSIPVVVDSHVVGMRSLLSHCKIHGNADISKDVFNQIAIDDNVFAKPGFFW